MNIYANCPILESETFMLKLVEEADCDELLKVYSDKNALPFFNSDNCNGDNFYYASKERMVEAFRFWDLSYKNGWFARLAIVNKKLTEVIGTVELCLRVSEDAFNDMAILRVDVGSDYEKENVLYEIVTLVTSHISEMLECDGMITKAPIYAVERIAALKKAGFTKSEHLLIAHNGYAYDGYWILK